MELTEEQMDQIVEQIKEPIRELDLVHAELLILHAAFQVSCSVQAMQGKTLKEQKEHLKTCFEMFLEGNPDIKQLFVRH